MADFFLVSERGTEIIKSALLGHDLLLLALSKKKKGWSCVLSEVMESEISILNCHQAKEILIDFCRLELNDDTNRDFLALLPLLVECIDSIHLKIILKL